MKLKVIDKTTGGTYATGEKRISLYLKNGTINFSAELARAGIFKPNSKIAFYQDEARPKDWYMAESETGFTLKEKKDGILSLTSAKFCSAIAESVKFNGKTCSFLVATEPMENEGIKLYAILTPSIKFKEEKDVSLPNKM